MVVKNVAVMGSSITAFYDSGEIKEDYLNNDELVNL